MEEQLVSHTLDQDVHKTEAREILTLGVGAGGTSSAGLKRP